MRRLLPAVLAACALLAPTSALASTAPSPRIVGGHTAAAGSWPALVALEDRTRTHVVQDTQDWDWQICGGTLVAPQWVLTAAHCVTNESTGALKPAANYLIMYGSRALDDTGTKVQVAEIHRHPAYDRAARTNDVALLKLATPVPGASVLPVAGPPVSALWNTVPGVAQVAGWGNLDQNDPDDQNPPAHFPVDLQETTVPLVSDADCGNVYDDFAPTVMLCAGDLVNGGVDTCQGDSGGPLTVTDVQGHQVLAGDTSFGGGCAWPGVPGVYGEIAGMRAFIDATIGWVTGASASTGSLSFGAPTDGAQTVTLTSTGTAPLSVGRVELDGSYGLSANTCAGVVLMTGQSCSVAVRPNVYGTIAPLTFVDDAPGGTTTVQLSTAPAPLPAPARTPTVAPETPQQQPPARRPVARLPRVTLTALSGHRVKVTSSGAGTVGLTFTRAVRRGRRTVRQTLATATIKFTNKGSKTITLRLTAAGRAALAHGRHVRAASVIEVKVTGAGSGRTGSLTLR